MKIGSRGLQEADLVIAQGCSLDFLVIPRDEEGNVLQLSAVRMALQRGDGTGTLPLSDHCSASAEGITVSIPASVTRDIDAGWMVWDMIVDTSTGDSTCILYGSVTVYDTYAKDEDDGDDS